MDFAREPKRVQGAQFSSDAGPKAESASQQVFHRSKSVFSRNGPLSASGPDLMHSRFHACGQDRKTWDFEKFCRRNRTENSECHNQNSDETRRRLGVTVSKRVGNSVIRNRVKRRIREWFRHAREGLPEWIGHSGNRSSNSSENLSGSEVAAVLDQTVHCARTRRGDRTTAVFR